MNGIHYTWEEMTLFAGTFAICLAIVVYFALKRTTLNDYVSGGGSMGVWPLSMSLVATSLSSITLGFANEVYQFGPHVMFDLVGVTAMGTLGWILIPVLHPLKLSSLNDYGDLRFNKHVKLIMSIFALMYMTIHATVVCYSTALFVSQISGLGYMTCFLIVTITSYVLTSVGGFKGVVWTDTVQAGAIFISVVTLAAIGLKEFGGPTEVYKAALERDRLSFDWSLSLTKRVTVWSAFIAFPLQRISSNSIATPCIYQRYAALSDLSKARKMTIVHTLGIVFVVSFTILLGYIITALFKDCDPVLSGKAVKYDQVLAYFIEYMGERSRISRSVYIIGFICASVSTITTEMNTFAITLYQDFIHERFNKVRGQRMIPLVGLLIVIMAILLVQVLQHSGSVTDLLAILVGPGTIYVAIILIGVFLPWIGPKGVLWASFVCLVTISWISAGAQLAYSRGGVTYPIKPMSVKECPTVNSSSVTKFSSSKQDTDVFLLFKITTFLHPFIGIIIMLVVSTVVTLATGSNDLSRLDQRLCSPWVRRFFPKPENKTVGDVLTPLKTLTVSEGSVNGKECNS